MDAQVLAAKSLFDAFLITASRDPHTIAWIAANPNETRPAWTWSDLRESVFRAASYLADRGVKKGDRIANLGRNCAQWAILDLACSAIGAIHAPIDTRYPVEWIERCLRDLQPALVFADRSTNVADAIHMASIGESSRRHARSTIETSAGSNDFDDPAAILFTSGTTNHPRGVVLSHRNLLSNAIAKLEAMPQSSSDLRLNLLPFSHSYARTCELTAWVLSGGTMACAHGIDAAIQYAPRLRPQLINAVPLFYERIACSVLGLHSQGKKMGRLPSNAPIASSDPSAFLGGSIRRLACGGAPINEILRNSFSDSGLPIFQGYGLTEAAPVVCSNRASITGEPILDGVGPPVSGVRVRVDADRRIMVAGPGVMLGYWRDPEGTSARIRDGWLDTGDLAAACCIESCNSDVTDQSLQIEGRSDDVQVLASGYKFSPKPMELRLMIEIESIEHCVLLGTGRHHALLAVQRTPNYEHVDGAKILGRAKEVLWDVADFARPMEIWIEREVWSVSNGCLHWKGTLNRRKIAERIAAAGSS
jgi:long-chain acyl-CoA synthetase